MRAGRADDVSLDDAVTTDADGAYPLAVAIKRNAAGTNRDAVGKARVEAGCVQNEIRERGAIEAGELFLQAEVGSGILNVEAGWIFCLGEKTNGPRGHRQEVVREADRGPSFLHGDIPTEERRFTGAERAEDRGPDIGIVWIVFNGDENFHRNPDGQTNSRARRPGASGSEIDDARDFRRGQPRLAVDRPGNWILDDCLADFALHAAEGRDGIWKWGGRSHDRESRSSGAVQRAGDAGRRRLNVGQRDDVDVTIVGGNRAGRAKSGLSCERDFFVDVVIGNERERILRTKNDRARSVVAGHADAADVDSIFVKRNAARRTVERSSEHWNNRQAWRWTESNDAARRAELVDVRREQIREPDADQRTGRGVAHAGREMLLDDEAGGPRRERVLVAAQIRRGPGFRDAAGNIERARRRPVHAPDREHVSLAIGHGNDAVRRNLEGARGRLVDDRLDVDGGELGGNDDRRQEHGGQKQCDAESHGARFHTKIAELPPRKSLLRSCSTVALTLTLLGRSKSKSTSKS